MSPLLSDLSGGSPASLPVSPPGPSLWCWVSSEAEGCPRRPAVVSVVEHVCVREAREIRPGIVPGCSLKSIRISWPCDICIHRNLTALLPQHPSRQRDQLFNLYTYTHTHVHTLQLPYPSGLIFNSVFTTASHTNACLPSPPPTSSASGPLIHPHLQPPTGSALWRLCPPRPGVPAFASLLKPGWEIFVRALLLP